MSKPLQAAAFPFPGDWIRPPIEIAWGKRWGPRQNLKQEAAGDGKPRSPSNKLQ